MKNKNEFSFFKMTNKKVPTDYIFVDGLGVGDVSNVVLRDRNALAEDGIVVVIAKMDRKGEIIGLPDLVSRGFVHMKENKELIDEVRRLAKKAATNTDKQSDADRDYVKRQIRDEVGRILFKKTERRPMILPVIIEV
jgi:ribonuclease J